LSQVVAVVVSLRVAVLRAAVVVQAALYPPHHRQFLKVLNTL
jgi:hypothetical protein